MQIDDTREELNADWWRWQMYRQVAALIHNPSLEAETCLKTLVAEYRRFAMHSANALEPSHMLSQSSGRAA